MISRSGFIKLALEHGTPIVPVMAFGTFPPYLPSSCPSLALSRSPSFHPLPTIRQSLNPIPTYNTTNSSSGEKKCLAVHKPSEPTLRAVFKWTNIPLVLIRGVFGSWVPFRVPITVVFGEPITASPPDLAVTPFRSAPSAVCLDLTPLSLPPSSPSGAPQPVPVSRGSGQDPHTVHCRGACDLRPLPRSPGRPEGRAAGLHSPSLGSCHRQAQAR